jgi:para-nitrobenzyl esterase
MDKLIIAAAAFLLTSPALAQNPAPASTAATSQVFSVEKTDVGTLIDTPATKAVLDKHMPGFSTSPQVDMARSMTLKMLQQFSPDNFTDEKLAAIESDLSKIK